MAQRGAWTPDKVRERIQTSMLLNRLHDHIVGEAEISPTQMKAIEILLRKSLPDLQAVEHTGDALNPVRVVLEQSEANA